VIDGEQVPLVLTPSGDGKVEAMVAALKVNCEWVEAKVVAPAATSTTGSVVSSARSIARRCDID
jgi:hypothetical protein